MRVQWNNGQLTSIKCNLVNIICFHCTTRVNILGASQFLIHGWLRHLATLPRPSERDAWSSACSCWSSHAIRSSHNVLCSFSYIRCFARIQSIGGNDSHMRKCCRARSFSGYIPRPKNQRTSYVVFPAFFCNGVRITDFLHFFISAILMIHSCRAAFPTNQVQADNPSFRRPLAGPLISGFVSRNLGWRWVFWIALIIIGACLPIIWSVPETYVPILERKMFPSDVSKSEKQPGTSERIQVVAEFLTRPIRMMYKEPILLLSSSFLSFEYALMYLVFQAYPIVFGSVYGMTQDKVGLAYIPCKCSYYAINAKLIDVVMFGCAIAFVVFQLYSNYHAEAVTQKRAWALVEEYRRLPLACIGGPW